VYGSIASAQERSESDIDLMVIGSVSPADLALTQLGMHKHGRQ